MTTDTAEGTGIGNLGKYRFLLGQLVVREIKLKYKRSVLGIVWSVLNPLLMMTIMGVVFSHMFRADIPNYLVFYLAGFLPYSFLQEATNGSLTAIIGNTGLLTKVYVPKYIFPVAKTAVALVNMGFAFIAFTAIAAITGVHASLALLVVPLIFLGLAMFVLGLGLIFSTVAVFFRDMIHFHSILMMMWMYLTPIFYPASIIPARFRWVIDANPLYLYIQSFRMVVLNGAFPSGPRLLACLAAGALVLWLGYVVFRNNEGRFVLHF